MTSRQFAIQTGLLLAALLVPARAVDVAPGEFENPAAQLAAGHAETDWVLKADATFGWQMGTLMGKIAFGGHTLTVDTGGGNDAALEGPLQGPGNLVWIGGGSTLDDQLRAGRLGGGAANSLRGTLTLVRGTLAFAKPANVPAWSGARLVAGGGANQAVFRWDADHQVADACDVLLQGPSVARLWMRGHAEMLGRLSLQADGEINLSGGDSRLHFADSSGVKWAADAELIVRGWRGPSAGKGPVSLGFGSSVTALTPAQLAQIGFDQPAGLPAGLYHARLLPTGELVPTGSPVVPLHPPFDLSETAKAERRKVFESRGLAELTGQQTPLRPGMKLAFFGDSITWLANGPSGEEPVAANPANNFEDSEAYYDLIGRGLLRAGLQGVTLFNHALNGGGVRELHDGREHTGEKKGQVLQPPFAKLLDRDQPEVAIVFIGVNDAGWRQTEPAEFRHELAAMADEAAARKVKLVLVTPALDGERPDGSNEHDERMDLLALKVRQVAAEKKAALVDLRTVFLARLRNENGEIKLNGRFVVPRAFGWLTADGIHFNDAGNALAADWIAAGIEAALQGTASGSAAAVAGPVSRLPVESWPLIPWPKRWEAREGRLMVTAASRIVVANPALDGFARVLAGDILAAQGLRLTIAREAAKDGDIELVPDSKLGEEAYVLEIGSRAVVRGKLPWGTVTLLQLLRAEPGGVSLPKLLIQDEPALPMRAISVDVARMPHSIEGLTQIVDLCRLYKLNYLHLHLTDDSAFLFPSRRFPRLPAASANQGRPPYSREELVMLERYAAERGVFVMPEIEAPGHAALMLGAMPELFKISFPAAAEAEYEPSSAINIAKPEVMKAICALWEEVCQVFSSTPYVHAACDEADFTPWGHLNPEFRAAFERYGFRRKNPAENVHLVYSRYIVELRECLSKQGKRMVVWENGAVLPSPEVAVPKDILVQPFDSYNPAEFTDAGFCVVNAAWTPLYIVNTATNAPEQPWRPRERYAHALPFLWRWSVEQFGTRGPGIEGFDYRRVPFDRVKGAQLTTWEQGEHAEVSTLRRRAAVVSERTWQPGREEDYAGFRGRLAHTDGILDRLISPVRLSAEGLEDEDMRFIGEHATLSMHTGPAVRKDAVIRYTLDGSLPKADSPLFYAPVPLRDDVFVAAAAFAPDGRRLGRVVREWYRREFAARENLARNRPVTSSAGEFAAQAVDGVLSGGWTLNRESFKPGEQPALTIDLGEAKTLKSVRLLFGLGASFRYRLEGSVDGANWRLLADRTASPELGSVVGNAVPVSAQAVRFVKLTLAEILLDGEDAARVVEVETGS